MSAIFIAAVTDAQGPSEDLTAEQQLLAQRKAELDAREKALDKREKMLAEKERATATSTSRSREKRKSQGQASANHSPEPGRTSESGARRKETTRTIRATPGRSVFGAVGHARLTCRLIPARRTRVAFHLRHSIRHLFPRLIGKLAARRSSVIQVSFHPFH